MMRNMDFWFSVYTITRPKCRKKKVLATGDGTQVFLRVKEMTISISGFGAFV